MLNFESQNQAKKVILSPEFPQSKFEANQSVYEL